MTKSEAMNMTTEELIKAFSLFQPSEFVRGKGWVYKPQLYARRIPPGISNEEALSILSPRKQEVLDFLQAERDAKEKAAAERQARIDAIPGLKEIRAAEADLEKWHREFNRSFEGDCGGLGVRPKPQYDIAAMKKQYPVATAYLEAEAESLRANDELAGIGQTALEAIIADPDNYAEALAKMKKAQDEFAMRHAWD